MPKRIANISPYHIGTLDAFTDAFTIVIEKASEIVDGGEKYNFRRVFFSSMFQSGVDGFRFYGDNYERFVDSDFIRKRIVKESYNKISLIDDELKALITNKYLKSTPTKLENTSLGQLRHFLSDLILALHTKRSMVTTLGIPNTFELEKYLKPEFILFLNNLFNCISTINIESPVPILSFEKKEIEIFEEIIRSDLFEEYVSSQKELENRDNKLSDVILYIKDKSINLIKKFRQNVYLKDHMIKVVDIGDNAVNTFGNKITSFLSKNLSNELKSMLNNDKRIIIYNFNHIFTEIFMQRLSKIKNRIKTG